MIHTSFSTYVIVAIVAAGITMALLLPGLRRPSYWYPYPDPIVGISVKSGLVAAVLLTLFVATKGHAALVRNAAATHLSVGYILACGFAATFLLATVAVLMFLTGFR